MQVRIRERLADARCRVLIEPTHFRWKVSCYICASGDQCVVICFKREYLSRNISYATPSTAKGCLSSKSRLHFEFTSRQQ
jgi:hypothetical protein